MLAKVEKMFEDMLEYEDTDKDRVIGEKGILKSKHPL